MKKFTLKFIQMAWVVETIALILFSMASVLIVPPERVGLWLQLFPFLSALIAAQGAAAGIGPLAADAINNKIKEKQGA